MPSRSWVPGATRCSATSIASERVASERGWAGTVLVLLGDPMIQEPGPRHDTAALPARRRDDRRRHTCETWGTGPGVEGRETMATPVEAGTRALPTPGRAVTSTVPWRCSRPTWCCTCPTSSRSRTATAPTASSRSSSTRSIRPTAPTRPTSSMCVGGGNIAVAVVAVDSHAATACRVAAPPGVDVPLRGWRRGRGVVAHGPPRGGGRRALRRGARRRGGRRRWRRLARPARVRRPRAAGVVDVDEAVRDRCADVGDLEGAQARPRRAHRAARAPRPCRAVPPRRAGVRAGAPSAPRRRGRPRRPRPCRRPSGGAAARSPRRAARRDRSRARRRADPPATDA